MIQNHSDPHKARQETVKIMDLEQFDCIVNAIVEGKYSWACVLILRFAGYNPAHYIPYRTYKRLIKESRRSHQTTGQTNQEPVSTVSVPSPIPASFPSGVYNSRLTRTGSQQNA